MSRLTDKDLKILKAGGTYAVGNNDFWNSPLFGTVAATDRVEIHVYDLSDNLITSGKVSDYQIASSGNIILKPGDTLRKMGFLSGDFKVVYNFFRNIAGQDDIVLVETLPTKIGMVYSGPPSVTGFEQQDYWVNSDGVIFKGQEGDTSMPEELDVRELKYFVQAISPSKTEIRLAPLDIKLDSYKNNFANLYTDEMVYTPDTRGSYGRLHLQDSSTFEFNIPSYYVQSTRINENMVGGKLRIEDAFITGYNRTHTALTILDTNVIVTDFEYSPTDTDWDSILHVDAVRPTLTWTVGYQDWVDSPGLGYHPMWVDREGSNDSLAVKFIDNNAQYSLPHRQLSVFGNHIESLASKGIEHGDIIRATWKQKSNASKYINVRMKYTPYSTEPKPEIPPTGFVGTWAEAKPNGPPLGFNTMGNPTANFNMLAGNLPLASFTMSAVTPTPDPPDDEEGGGGSGDDGGS